MCSSDLLPIRLSCINDDEGLPSEGFDVPYEYREAPFYTRIQDIRPHPGNVNKVASSISLSLLMLLSIASSGCMGLAMQRELMEGMREA